MKVRAEECPEGGNKIGWNAPEYDVEKWWFPRKWDKKIFLLGSWDGRYLEIVILIFKLVGRGEEGTRGEWRVA